MGKRDDFSKYSKNILAERANQRCSNPDCGLPTSGPHSISSKSIIVGVAAHICAAASRGKRYDPDMTPLERSSIDNAIWLCARCAKLIDSDEIRYTPDLIRKWKIDHESSCSRELVSSGLLDKKFVEDIPSLNIQEFAIQSKQKVETKIAAAYPKITATDLVDAGFRKDKVHIFLSILDESIKKQNYRFAKFLSKYVDEKRNKVPRTWSALIAGLPIVSEDIGSKSLDELSVLAKELHPYLSRELRGIYHNKLRVVIIGVIAEVQAFIQDAAATGGLPLAITAAPPVSWKVWLPWYLGEEGVEYRIEDQLLQGKWAYSMPVQVAKYDIDVRNTWAGILYDIVSRLPDPDRQKGQLLRKFDFMALMSIWCATAPQDFKPALTGIVRQPVHSSDHTLAGMYNDIKEYMINHQVAK